MNYTELIDQVANRATRDGNHATAGRWQRLAKELNRLNELEQGLKRLVAKHALDGYSKDPLEAIQTALREAQLAGASRSAAQARAAAQAELGTPGEAAAFELGWRGAEEHSIVLAGGVRSAVDDGIVLKAVELYLLAQHKPRMAAVVSNARATLEAHSGEAAAAGGEGNTPNQSGGGTGGSGI